MYRKPHKSPADGGSVDSCFLEFLEVVAAEVRRLLKSERTRSHENLAGKLPPVALSGIAHESGRRAQIRLSAGAVNVLSAPPPSEDNTQTQTQNPESYTLNLHPKP